MTALNGQVMSTITNGAGASVVTITWFFNVTTRALINNPAPWTAPDGTVYATNAGALIADNQTGRQIRAVIKDATDTVIRQVTLPSGGKAVKANTLANLAPPNGPYLVSEDFNGITFDLA